MQARNYAGGPPPQFRKGPGPMIRTPQTRPSQQQWNEEQAKIREQTEAARNRSQKPTDRDLPDGIDELVLEESARSYQQLREAEKQLDAVMLRKRLDAQESIGGSSQRTGTLRIWISNTVDNQPWQQSGMSHDAFDFNSNVEATFRVKIEGRLLDKPFEKEDDKTTSLGDGNDQKNETDAAEGADANGTAAAKTKALQTTTRGRRKFSHFFRSITVDFDRPASLQPDNYTRIQWERPLNVDVQRSVDLPKEADFDCLEFQRKGDESMNIIIKMARDEDRQPKSKLSEPLAELLDVEEADKKTVIMAIWEYVKANGLLDEGETRRIHCDDRLKAALGLDTFLFPQLSELINRCLFEVPPIELQYTIRVDKDHHTASPSNPNPPAYTIYDIPVSLEDPMRAQLSQITASTVHPEALQRLIVLDDQIAMSVQAIKHAKARHAFFTEMSRDPANFIKRWTSSQKRDLDVILGAAPWGDEDWQGAEWRMGGEDGPWGTREAAEGVGGFLSRMDSTKPKT